MAIDVTVVEQCDRCKRKERIIISSDKLAEFEAKQHKAVALREAVQEFVETNELPDLVVIFKGQVRMLSNVCDAHCAKPVKNNIDTLFREHKERKPRTKKAKNGDAKDAQNAEAPSEAVAQGKSKGKGKGAAPAAA